MKMLPETGNFGRIESFGRGSGRNVERRNETGHERRVLTPKFTAFPFD